MKFEILSSLICGVSTPVLLGITPTVCKQIKQTIDTKNEQKLINNLSTENFDAANEAISKNLINVNQKISSNENDDSSDIEVEIFDDALQENRSLNIVDNRHNVPTYSWSETHPSNPKTERDWGFPEFHKKDDAHAEMVYFNTCRSNHLRLFAHRFDYQFTIPPHTKPQDYQLNIDCKLNWHTNNDIRFLKTNKMDFTCELFNFGNFEPNAPTEQMHPEHFSNLDLCTKNQFDRYTSDAWAGHVEMNGNDFRTMNFTLHSVVKNISNDSNKRVRVYAHFMLSFMVEGVTKDNHKSGGDLHANVSLAKQMHGNCEAETDILSHKLIQESIINDTMDDKNWTKERLKSKFSTLRDTFNEDVRLNKDKLISNGIEPKLFKWNSADEFADDLVNNKNKYKKDWLDIARKDFESFISARKADMSGWFNTEFSINDSVGIKVKKVSNNTINSNIVDFNELTDYSLVYPHNFKQKIDYNLVTNKFYVDFINDWSISDAFVMYIPIKAKVTLPYKLIDCYYDFVPCMSYDFNANLQKEDPASGVWKKDKPYTYTIQLYDFENNKSAHPQILPFANRLKTNFTNFDKNLLYLNNHDIDTEHTPEHSNNCCWNDLYSPNKGDINSKLFHQQKKVPSRIYSTRSDNEKKVEFEAYYGVAITIQGGNNPWRKINWSNINFTLQMVDKEQCFNIGNKSNENSNDNKYEAIAYESNNKSGNKIYLKDMKKKLNEIGYSSTPEGGQNGLVFNPTRNDTTTRAFYQRTHININIPAKSSIFLEIYLSPTSLFNRTPGLSFHNTHFANNISLFKLHPNQPNPEWIPGIDYNFNTNLKTDEELSNGLIFSQTNKDFVKHSTGKLLTYISIGVVVIAAAMIGCGFYMRAQRNKANKEYSDHLSNKFEKEERRNSIKDDSDSDIDVSLDNSDMTVIQSTPEQIKKEFGSNAIPLTSKEIHRLSKRNADPVTFLEFGNFTEQFIDFDKNWEIKNCPQWWSKGIATRDLYNEYRDAVKSYKVNHNFMHYAINDSDNDSEKNVPYFPWPNHQFKGQLFGMLSSATTYHDYINGTLSNCYSHAMPNSANISYNNSCNFNADGSMREIPQTFESASTERESRNFFLVSQIIFNNSDHPKTIQLDFGIGFVHDAQDSKEKDTSSTLNACINIKKYGFTFIE